MGRPPSESSREEVNASEVRSLTDHPQSPNDSDVLRHPDRFTKPKASESSVYTEFYSPAWVELREAEHTLDAINRRGNQTDVDQCKKVEAQNTLEEAQKCFDQTTEGQILKEIKIAIQNARQDLDNTDQKKNLNAATDAVKAAEAAFKLTPQKKKMDDLSRSASQTDLHSPSRLPRSQEVRNAALNTKEWRNLTSAKEQENAAEKALHRTPKSQQLEALKSLQSKAYKAWKDLQKQAQLYTWKHTETEVDAASRAVGEAASELKEAQNKRKPGTFESLISKEYYNVTSRVRESNIRKKKEVLQRLQDIHKFEQFLHKEFRTTLHEGTIPKPNESTLKGALQAWEQSQQEFRDFQRRNNQEE